MTIFTELRAKVLNVGMLISNFLFIFKNDLIKIKKKENNYNITRKIAACHRPNSSENKIRYAY